MDGFLNPNFWGDIMTRHEIIEEILDYWLQQRFGDRVWSWESDDIITIYFEDSLSATEILEIIEKLKELDADLNKVRFGCG